MKQIGYREVADLSAASSLLAELGAGAQILAGGTDVIVRLNKDMSAAETLVNIKGIPGLAGIREEKDGLVIGALTRLNSICASPLVRKHFPALAEAVESIGTNQIRNLGTLGGNICNASPCADSVCPLIALEAVFKLQGGQDTRSVPAGEFFTGPGKTVRRRDEILKGVFIPYVKAGTLQAFRKLGPRKSADIAIINMAAVLTVENGSITSARLVYGSVAPTAIRAGAAEALLAGKALSGVDAEAVGKAAAAEVKPITDVRGSMEYRRKMAENMTMDLIAELKKEAR